LYRKSEVTWTKSQLWFFRAWRAIPSTTIVQEESKRREREWPGQSLRWTGLCESLLPLPSVNLFGNSDLIIFDTMSIADASTKFSFSAAKDISVMSAKRILKVHVMRLRLHPPQATVNSSFLHFVFVYWFLHLPFYSLSYGGVKWQCHRSWSGIYEGYSGINREVIV
jgi:hypothetical protein